MFDRFAHLDDDELTASLRDLEADQRTLDARRAELLLVWDRRQAWANDGSVTAAARLARETRIAGATARERMRLAKLLASMPRTHAALAELGWAKAKLLTGVINERTIDAFERHEELLVEQALELDVDHLAKLLAHWKRLVDLDGANADLDAVHARDYLQVSESLDGVGFVHGRLSGENLQIVTTVLAQIADELYRAERHQAMCDTLAGDTPDEPRTPAERNADALAEIARRAAATTEAADAGDHVTPAKPLVLVHVDVDHTGDVLARFADGTPLVTDDAVRLACDAAVARVLTKNGSVPLDLGRTTRDPSDAQRKALSVLWPTCAFPGCCRPFSWCQLHHVIYWEHGGRTDVSWLIPLCTAHHRRQHRGMFTIHRRPDGTFTFTRADGTLIGDANPTITRLYGRLRDLPLVG